MSLLDIVAALLNQYGVGATAVIVLFIANAYFVRRAVRKEDRLQAQIDNLNKEMRDTVIPVLVQCKDAITQNSQVLLRLINGRSE